MARSLIICIGFALLVATASEGLAEKKQFLSDYLSLPPVLERYFGNPAVHISAERSRETTGVCLLGSNHPIFFVHPRENASEEEIRSAISARLLNRFYNKRISLRNRHGSDRRLKLEELIPLDKETFRQIGTDRLAGRSTGSPVYDAWWSVRMGMPLTTSSTHQLAIINLHSDKSRITAGHFTFGYRKRGGDPESDVMFDFRAPWDRDREPYILEGMNFLNTLTIEGTAHNFYDWCYTQTQFRGCFIKFWFVPIAEEQLILLQDFARSGRIHDGGHFKGLKKNCASLGEMFYERILSFDDTVGNRDHIADLPIETAERIRERYTAEPVYCRIENITEELGRERTAKSEVHRAQPSRQESRSFRTLATVPGIN